ncbi:hypothetical protein EGT07_25640 [Herbaspirillum sp. HC18]|nr:hypothetical protein EGT07_25640 [Herbaspirillum sp. HC18]
MKSTSFLVAAVLAFGTALTFNATAASDANDTANGIGTQQPETKKKVKPHSHLEEKTGVYSKAELATEEKPADKPATPKKNPAMDFSKHYHPRDGK